jgi:hypothetical protein
VLQWLLLVAAVAGAVWTVVLLVAGSLSDDSTPRVAGAAVPLVLLVGGLVLGLVLALVCRVVLAGSAKGSAAAVDQELRRAVSSVSRELVVAPVEEELAAYTRLRAGLAKALK